MLTAIANPIPASAVDAWVTYSDAVAAQLRAEMTAAPAAERVDAALAVHRAWLVWMDAMGQADVSAVCREGGAMSDRKAMETFGRAIGKGLLAEAIHLAFTVVIVFAIGGALLDAFQIGYDDSDDAAHWHRSGLRVRTDYLSGCQYLEARSGGLTPRNDAAGRQVCR